MLNKTNIIDNVFTSDCGEMLNKLMTCDLMQMLDLKFRSSPLTVNTICLCKLRGRVDTIMIMTEQQTKAAVKFLTLETRSLVSFWIVLGETGHFEGIVV